jgi:hypothetical protein
MSFKTQWRVELLMFATNLEQLFTMPLLLVLLRMVLELVVQLLALSLQVAPKALH